MVAFLRQEDRISVYVVLGSSLLPGRSVGARSLGAVPLAAAAAACCVAAGSWDRFFSARGIGKIFSLS